jgi:hypothetical protein
MSKTRFSLKMTVFWDFALMMEGVSTSEMSVNFYETTRATTQKTVSHLHTRRHENLKSQVFHSLDATKNGEHNYVIQSPAKTRSKTVMQPEDSSPFLKQTATGVYMNLFGPDKVILTLS